MQNQNNNHKNLQGKKALVTGGSRGIGRGIAIQLAERGASVAINYVRNEEAAKDTLQKVQQAGSDGFIIHADVSDEKDINNMIKEVNDTFGEIDIFINNALGNLLGFMEHPLQVSLDQWEAAYLCQSRAFLLGVQGVAKIMQNDGRIIALSYYPGSHAGGFLPYFAMGANKACLESMCRYFAVALAPRGITVNAVCAGITDDSIVNSLPKEAQEAMLLWLKAGWNPMRRPGTPQDIGSAVAALCSSDAGWITGQTIVADGGASLMSPEVPLEFQKS